MTRNTIGFRLFAAVLTAAAGWALAPVALAEPELERPLAEQLAADDAAIAAQDRVDQASDETRDLLLQYRQYLSEARSLRDYTRQLSVQVQSQKDEIGFIQQQLVEIETTAREVLPLMEKMVDKLERFVEFDLPFLLEERRQRVASLKETMGRADVTISEKYRRILEAYQIENDYGRTLESYQGELSGERDEAGVARTVRFLRVGRVTLLYQTLDGEETGYWDANQKKWVADDSYRRAVIKGFEVADKLGAPDLISAPIPAPVESRS